MLNKAADIILIDCMRLRRDERLLIVTDTVLHSLAAHVFGRALRLTDAAILIVMKERRIHGEEPPEEIRNALINTDVALLLTHRSLSHTRARKEASRRGVRIASLPGATEAMLRRAIPVDYKQMHAEATRLVSLLERTDHVHITTPRGTALSFSIKGRKAFVDSGRYHTSGAFGNLPAGEACCAPCEGTANGTVIVDGSFPLLGKVHSPFSMEFRNGFCVAMAGTGAARIQRIIGTYGKKGFNLAEFGIGINPRARITGVVLEDEKMRGTIHLALGNNRSFGGSVDVALHLDAVLMHPRIYLDSRELRLKP